MTTCSRADAGAWLNYPFLTSKERDIETGLDYFGTRYYASMQGRFTSPDGFWKDSQVGDPQSWNKYGYARNNPLKYIDPEGEKATVTIQTDEEKRRGTIKVKASIAIWAGNKNISKEAMNKAAADIKKSIESSIKGTYEQGGIKFEVSAEIDVNVTANENEAMKSGALNVIELSNGPADGETDAYMDPAPIFGGPDTGKWNIHSVATQAGHEFNVHGLGVWDKEGPYFANTYPDRRSSSFTAYDYGWVFGGAINQHRESSKQNSNCCPYPGVRMTTKVGQPRSHTSTRELRTGKIWWR